MIEIKDKLPFWLKGPEALKLAAAVKAFFTRWENWLGEVAPQADIANCSPAALELHAWERGVARLPGESEALWRERVRHAITAAIESGSKKGLELILGVHGVLNFQVLERVEGDDWDIVRIELDPVSLSADSDLLGKIFTEWGRVCRRYIISYTVPVPVYHGVSAYTRSFTVEEAA